MVFVCVFLCAHVGPCVLRVRVCYVCAHVCQCTCVLCVCPCVGMYAGVMSVSMCVIVSVLYVCVTCVPLCARWC